MSLRTSYSVGMPLNSIPKSETNTQKVNGEVTSYTMTREEMEAYLIDKYGIKKLRDSAKRAEKAFVERGDRV